MHREIFCFRGLSVGYVITRDIFYVLRKTHRDLGLLSLFEFSPDQGRRRILLISGALMCLPIYGIKLS